MPAPVYTSLPIRQIAAEYKAGDSMRKLATRYSVSYGTIRNILAAARVPLRKQGRQSLATEKDARHTTTAYAYPPDSAIWEMIESGTLASAEVARLRQAIGWDASWSKGS